ncbi:MAG: hypothetical protein KF802_01225 [Bdellovibrionaceae bacterium]|nr:hypothetical protein [Pseudobdellovibrionaceae bacterium]
MNALLQNAQSERTRVLGTIKFEPGQNASLKFPNDTTIKGIILSLRGSVRTTYASGTPVAKAEGTMDSLVNLIEFAVDGRNTLKSLRPHILHIQNLLAFGVETPRFASAGAAPAPDNYPTTPGGFVFGTTGQYTTVRETVYMPFEQVYCEPGWGRERTYVNLRNHSSAELRLSFADFKNLLGNGNTAPVVFDNSTLQIEVSIVERSDATANVVFDQWKQYMVNHPIAGEGRALQYRVNTGNYITSLLFYATDGAPGSTTTATGKLASNLLVKSLELKANGRDGIQSWNWKDLQDYNRSVYGLVAPTANGVSRLDGIAHLNLLNRRQLDTMLPTMRPVIDDLNMYVDTNPSGIVDYTSGANLLMVTEELVLGAAPK